MNIKTNYLKSTSTLLTTQRNKKKLSNKFNLICGYFLFVFFCVFFTI